MAKCFSPPHKGAPPTTSSSCTLRPTQTSTPLCFTLVHATQPKGIPSPGWQKSRGHHPLYLQSTAETQPPVAERGHRSLGGDCGGGYQAASTMCMGMNQVERLLSQTTAVQANLLLPFGLQHFVAEEFSLAFSKPSYYLLHCPH